MLCPATGLACFDLDCQIGGCQGEEAAKTLRGIDTAAAQPMHIRFVNDNACGAGAQQVLLPFHLTGARP